MSPLDPGTANRKDKQMSTQSWVRKRATCDITSTTQGSLYRNLFEVKIFSECLKRCTGRTDSIEYLITSKQEFKGVSIHKPGRDATKKTFPETISNQ
jgi:hypothetical protein